MAQAGSAQREPSMEEILASIRRIIEDSDTGRKPGDEAAHAEPDAADGASSVYEPARRDAVPVRGEGAVIEVDAFRAELRAPNPPEPRKPVTLAEVQAQIAADARKRAGETMPAAQPEAAPAIEPARERPQAAEARLEPGRPEASTVQAAPEAPTSQAASAASVPSQSGGQVWERKEGVETATQPESSSIDESGSTSEVFAGRNIVGDSDAPAATESNVARPAIISEQASRQVAAAFGELSEAFATRSKKTFDEMAEEMMRPMLQDWLDNNLPTLVERLVREEIERVARGAS
jgi:cell pole-organizing protein PopZ